MAKGRTAIEEEKRESLYQDILKVKPAFKKYLRKRPTMEEVADLILEMKEEENPRWKALLKIASSGVFESKNYFDSFAMPPTYKCLDEETNVLRREYVGHTGFDEISFDFENNKWDIIEIGIAI